MNKLILVTLLIIFLTRLTESQINIEAGIISQVIKDVEEGRYGSIVERQRARSRETLNKGIFSIDIEKFEALKKSYQEYAEQEKYQKEVEEKQRQSSQSNQNAKNESSTSSGNNEKGVDNSHDHISNRASNHHQRDNSGWDCTITRGGRSRK